MKNQDDLIEDTKELSDKELAYVVQSIKETSPGDDSDLYALINTLGRAKAYAYKELIERFLYYPTNPIISKIALQTLCNYWDLTPHYLNELKLFLNGVEWDENEDIRLAAMRLSAAYYRKAKNKELLQILIAIFENETVDEFIRTSAYECIAYAMGKEWIEIPFTNDLLELLQEETLDLSLIDKAKKIVEYPISK